MVPSSGSLSLFFQAEDGIRDLKIQSTLVITAGHCTHYIGRTGALSGSTRAEARYSHHLWLLRGLYTFPMRLEMCLPWMLIQGRNSGNTRDPGRRATV